MSTALCCTFMAFHSHSAQTMVHRGTVYSLRPQQLAYILPGKGYTQEDLQSIATAAQTACSDDKLMELAWEVGAK